MVCKWTMCFPVDMEACHCNDNVSFSCNDVCGDIREFNAFSLDYIFNVCSGPI